MQSLPAQACRSMQVTRTRIAQIATERGLPKSESAEATGLKHDDLLEWNKQDAGASVPRPLLGFAGRRLQGYSFVELR
jgi:hypothetical protein